MGLFKINRKYVAYVTLGMNYYGSIRWLTIEFYGINVFKWNRFLAD